MPALVHDWIQARMDPTLRLSWIEHSFTFLYLSLSPLIQSRHDTETELRSERVLSHAFEALQNAKTYLRILNSLNRPNYTVPQDPIMLFLDTFLWHQGGQFLRIVRKSVFRNRIPGSPLPSMIAAANLLEAVEEHQGASERKMPDPNVAVNDINSLESVHIQASEDRTWVTFAVLVIRLGYDIAHEWQWSY